MEVARLKRGQEWRYALRLKIKINKDGTSQALSEATPLAMEHALGSESVAYVAARVLETAEELSRIESFETQAVGAELAAIGFQQLAMAE